MSEVNLTKDNFKSEILEGKGIAIVDFWAPWCGPCRMQAPILEELAAKHPEITVGKVNVDDEQELAMEYQIMSIPALMIFKDGQKVDATVGLTPLEKLEGYLS